MQEHNFFFLLLDDVHHLALVGDLLELDARVVATIVRGCGLEFDNLLPGFDVLFKNTSLSLELIVLSTLLLDVTLHLLEFGGDIADSLLSVVIKSLDLVVETLLDVLILLNVLLHNDFLSLLGDSVQLHVHSTLLEIHDFEVLDLALSLMELKLGLGIENIAHLDDLLFTLLLNLHVLHLDDVLLNENGILVVSSDGKLGHFNLSLLQVHNHLKVELKLRGSVLNLLALGVNYVEIILKTVKVTSEEIKVILELVESLVVGITSLFQFDTCLSLRHVLLELSLSDVGGAITLQDVDFFLLFNLNFSGDLVSINLSEGVIIDDTLHSGPASLF